MDDAYEYKFSIGEQIDRLLTRDLTEQDRKLLDEISHGYEKLATDKFHVRVKRVHEIRTQLRPLNLKYIK
ncbi:hypothetical protein SEA_CRUNCHYBOI_11 [Microbacterium phage CrunchyBoi]|nr:hypothetical protein SEA_CRUNCHYBOI_11 [Microbacterium phage CrunchyBoi]